MMISLNDINPNCYMVSKILDMAPQGILKLTFKQDDYNKRRDEPSLMICDYYDDSGDITIDEPFIVEDEKKTSYISYFVVNEDGEMVETEFDDSVIMHTGKTDYFSVTFSDDNVDAQWRITLDEESDDKTYIEKLMVVNQVTESVISIKPGKSSKVKGRKFTLSVSDADGRYYSSIKLEVVD